MHKIGFSVETIDDERRNALLAGLSELFTRVLRGADEVKIRFEHRRAYLRNGKGGTWREIKLEGGDFSFELIELGILSTQCAMDLGDQADDGLPSTGETTVVDAEIIVDVEQDDQQSSLIDDTPESWLDDDELRQLRERQTEAVGI